MSNVFPIGAAAGPDNLEQQAMIGAVIAWNTTGDALAVNLHELANSSGRPLTQQDARALIEAHKGPVGMAMRSAILDGLMRTPKA